MSGGADKPLASTNLMALEDGQGARRLSAPETRFNANEELKHMTTLRTWAAAGAMVVLSDAAQAALVDRGGGMIYDTTRNITWLADMNYALTSGHTGTGVSATDGRMSWDAATAWAANLVYGGFDD
jgi:heme A synthase